jgi:hypothetical protein
MNNARDAAWLKHLFRYQAQQRENGRLISANAIETVKVAAVLVLCDERPSSVRIAAESSTFLSEPEVRRCIDRLCALGVLHRRGAGLTACSHESWQNYNEHSPDPPNVERQVAGFVRDLEVRITDLARRQPKKRQA